MHNWHAIATSQSCTFCSIHISFENVLAPPTGGASTFSSELMNRRPTIRLAPESPDYSTMYVRQGGLALMKVCPAGWWPRGSRGVWPSGGGGCEEWARPNHFHTGGRPDGPPLGWRWFGRQTFSKPGVGFRAHHWVGGGLAEPFLKQWPSQCGVAGLRMVREPFLNQWPSLYWVVGLRMVL